MYWMVVSRGGKVILKICMRDSSAGTYFFNDQTDTHTHIHIYTHICIHAYTYTHTHMYIYIYKLYIHIYIHTYTHTHVYTYKHTYPGYYQWKSLDECDNVVVSAFRG